jgi:TetR/AcrR family transcriptional regulator, tetracycline repressor protein
MTGPAKRGRRGPRRALTEDEILDAALSLLDDGGPSAASVRGIAARVGVAPNAVYTYFPDKAAVVKALVERLLGEVDHGVFADRAQPWRHLGAEVVAPGGLDVG